MVVTKLQLKQPPTCGFCGQPLVAKEAAEYLALRTREFEAEIVNLQAKEAAEHARRATAAELTQARREAAAAKQKVVELRKQARSMRAEVTAEERTRIDKEYAARIRAQENTTRLLQRQNVELSRRIEKMTAKERGDAGELDLVAGLGRLFSDDRIEHRGKGGDVIQTVRQGIAGKMQAVGTIVYECKEHVAWRASFLAQARAAGEQQGTPYVVLVSQALPAREKGPICVRNGVLIVQPSAALHVAELLRRTVVAVHQAARSAEDREAKTARLFEYLSGEEFRQSVDGVLARMAEEETLLTDEQRTHARTWERRQTLNANVRSRISTIEGRVRAIIEAAST